MTMEQDLNVKQAKGIGFGFLLRKAKIMWNYAHKKYAAGNTE